MMERFEFSVRGSQPEPYLVAFEVSDGNVHVYCNCKAGENGLACKHWQSLVGGDLTNMISENSRDVGQLLDLFSGSRLEAAYIHAQGASQQFDAAKIANDAAKKALSRMMRK